MSNKVLSVDELIIDARTQNRLKIDQDTVETYTDDIESAKPDWPFPPLDVFSDSVGYVVADGFHRLLAARAAKRGSVPCVIHSGTTEDAKIFGMTANDRHGLRMTRADKRACVEWLLENRKRLSQKAIAELAGVCRRTVQMIVAEQNTPDTPMYEKAQFAPSQPELGQDRQDSNGEDDTDETATVGQERSSRPSRKDKDKPVVIDEPDPAWQANEVIKQWASTIGRWLAPIDDYVEKWPGETAEAVQKEAGDLYEALKKWRVK